MAPDALPPLAPQPYGDPRFALASEYHGGDDACDRDYEAACEEYERIRHLHALAGRFGEHDQYYAHRTEVQRAVERLADEVGSDGRTISLWLVKSTDSHGATTATWTTSNGCWPSWLTQRTGLQRDPFHPPSLDEAQSKFGDTARLGRFARCSPTIRRMRGERGGGGRRVGRGVWGGWRDVLVAGVGPTAMDPVWRV